MAPALGLRVALALALALSLAPRTTALARTPRAVCARATAPPRARVAAAARRGGASDDDPPPPPASFASKGAWYATELAGNLAALARGGTPAPAGAAVPPAGPPRSMREAIRRLEADYARRYFIVGAMDEQLYADDCEFADPFVSFKGRARFAANLANLAGGFITDSRVRTLDARADGAAYTTRLLVTLALNLPWRPQLAWVWGVTHEFDPRTLLVVRHVERWEVSAAEGVRQLFTPGPPGGLAQGRRDDAAAAAAPAPSLDPVIGPLVRLARASGLLAPEADGWEGEPSAWANADSAAQAASEWSARRLGGFKQLVAELAAGPFDAAPVDARIRAETAAARGVHVYAFTSCPFCKRARELLDAEGASYSLVQLDLDEEGPQVRARLGKLTGRTSLPAIWIGGEYVGGCNDGPGVASLARSGELRPMLLRAGALAGR
jgi:glutaredoxin